jgi:hypothetical protein
MHEIGIDYDVYEARLLMPRRGRSCPSCMRRSIVCTCKSFSRRRSTILPASKLPHASTIYKSQELLGTTSSSLTTLVSNSYDEVHWQQQHWHWPRSTSINRLSSWCLELYMSTCHRVHCRLRIYRVSSRQLLWPHPWQRTQSSLS